jgi:hypothetical protein
MADVLKFPAKRGRPPILVWDDNDVGPPVHDARGRGPPRVHGAVPLGVLRPRARGMPGVCVLFMFAARNSTYNYRLCPLWRCHGAPVRYLGSHIVVMKSANSITNVVAPTTRREPNKTDFPIS